VVRPLRLPALLIPWSCVPLCWLARYSIVTSTTAANVAGLAATRAGLRGVDLNSGILGDVIVGANGKPVRRLADLTDQLESVGSIT